MELDFQFLGFAITFLWLILLSVLVWRLYSGYNKINGGLSEKSAFAFLEKLLFEQEVHKKELDILNKKTFDLELAGSGHIQKIGLVRFNPFKDTGGDQSFTLALLDKQQSGVVISGLYSRSGTRWYAKRIDNGKGVEHGLSEEEKKAISIAK